MILADGKPERVGRVGYCGKRSSIFVSNESTWSGVVVTPSISLNRKTRNTPREWNIEVLINLKQLKRIGHYFAKLENGKTNYDLPIGKIVGHLEALLKKNGNVMINLHEAEQSELMTTGG